MPPLEEIIFDMPGGKTARGYCNFAASAVEIEQVVVRHEMSDGTFAEERVWRPIAPPPAPTPAAAEAAPESADG